MNKFTKILINYLLGPLLFVVLSYVLYNQIVNQHDLAARWAEIKLSWKNPFFWLVVLLMLVNWGLESRKWQILVSHVQRFKFLKAFESVLAGCSITMLTPNRIGEYGGRILYVREENRLRAITLTILGSMAQLLITLLIGEMGLTLLLFQSQNSAHKIFDLLPMNVGEVLWVLVLVAVIVMTLLYLKVGVVVHAIGKIKWLDRVTRYIRLLEGFKRKELLRILFLSFIRYLVFILQFILMLRVMQVDIGWQDGFWALSVFYLVMAMAPTIGFTELPLRAATSAQILSAYSDNLVGIQAASLAIWLINIVLPAIVGTIIISGIKLFKEKENEVS